MTAQLKLAVLAVAAAALLTPTVATSMPSYNNNSFRVELDPLPSSGDEPVFRVVKASNWGRRYEGRNITLAVDEESRIRVPDRNNNGEAELSDLRPHDRIHVVARMLKDEDPSVARVTVQTLHITHPE